MNKYPSMKSATTVYTVEVLTACTVNPATETKEEAAARLKFLNWAYRWALKFKESTDLIREASVNAITTHDLGPRYHKTRGVNEADKAILQF